ncbi:hypothetical protein C7S13_3880 [Burkholderia cepacia]|nr:hypothetical protein [Burkholderia cepacia]
MVVEQRRASRHGESRLLTVRTPACCEDDPIVVRAGVLARIDSDEKILQTLQIFSTAPIIHQTNACSVRLCPIIEKTTMRQITKKCVLAALLSSAVVGAYAGTTSIQKTTTPPQALIFSTGAGLQRAHISG